MLAKHRGAVLPNRLETKNAKRKHWNVCCGYAKTDVQPLAVAICLRLLQIRLQNSLKKTSSVTIHAPFGDLEHADCQSGGPWSVLETGGNDN